MAKLKAEQSSRSGRRAEVAAPRPRGGRREASREPSPRRTSGDGSPAAKPTTPGEASSRPRQRPAKAETGERRGERLAWLAGFPEWSPSPIVEVDRDRGVVHYANPAAEAVFPDLAKDPTRHPFLAGLEAIAEELAHHPDRPARREVAVGASWYEQRIYGFDEGRWLRIYGFDITDRKQQERTLEDLRRTLRAHARSSHAMMRARDEREYLGDVCRFIVEDCGHAMAWIGFAEDDEGKTVQPVAHAGFDDGYLEALRITWADTERGRGPTGTAIRTRKPAGCPDMAADPAFGPWRTEALRRGYASSIVVPLVAGGRAFGAITIYSREANRFSDEEVALLTDLAADVAFGVTSLRTTAARLGAEETVRELAERLTYHVDTSPLAVIEWGPDMRLTRWAGAAERIFGWKAEEVLGKRMDQFRWIYEEDEAQVGDVSADLKSGANPHRFSANRNYRKDGSLVQCEWYNSSLLDAEGKLRSILSLVLDVTDRTQAEKALRESEAKYRNLFENMAEEVHFWRLVRDDEGRIQTWRLVDANAPALRTWGREIGELRGKTTDEIFGPGSTDHYMPIVEKITTEGVPVTYEDYFPNLDRYFRFTSVPLGDHFITTGADITERRRVEQAVQQERDRLAALVNSISDEVWFADTSRNFTLANPAAVREFGPASRATDVESLAASLEVLHPDGTARPVEDAPPLRALAGEVVTNQEELVRTPATGQLRYRQVSAAPVRDAAGQIIGSVSIVRDVTELKRAERRKELLGRTAARLLEADSPQAVIEELCAGVMAFLDCDVFFNYLADDAAGRLHLNACAGIGEGDARRVEWLDYGGAVCGCAARDGERIVAEDIQHCTDERTALVRSFGVQSYAAHPLLAQGRVLGTLSFGSRRRTRFTDDELSLMKEVADHVSLAIERKRAEDALRDLAASLERRVAERTADVEAGRKRFYDVLETLPAMICLLTREHHVAFANRSFRERFGEPDGRTCHEYCFGFSEPCSFCEAYTVLESGRPHRWQVDTPDGRSVIDCHDFPFTDADGTPLILEMDIDITAAKRAEEALARAAAYNRNLIEASLDPLVTISPDGKITDVNAATERATGRPRTDLVGTDFSDYFTEPERARAGYQQVFREGSVQDYPLEIRHREGRLTQVLYNASVYRDESGEVAGVFAAARDVTARRKAEEALARASAYNRNLLETSLDPLVTISPEGKVTDVNAATERVTGRTRGELVGTDFLDYFTEPERARTGYQQVFREGFVQDYPLEIRHLDGRITPVLYNASVFRDEGGRVVGVFAAARDVTERRRAEAEVRVYQQHLEELVEHRTAELRRSNENLEQFAYVASHDLQEPLRMMGSYSQLLERRYGDRLDADAGEFIGYIVDGAQRMQGLITDLLAYSRVGRADTRMVSVDCGEVVRRVLRSMAGTVEESGAAVTVGRLPTVDAVESQVAQLFQNLIGNAIKFRGERPPRIRVDAERTSEGWTFSVSDNGLGIEPQYAERVFQVFQRLHPRGRYPGTGIGLAICKKIVENRGGRIWVESEPGRGATFRFTIPSGGGESR